MKYPSQEKEYKTEYYQKCKREDHSRFLYYSAKRHCKTNGMKFEITKGDITIPAICPVLGISLEIKQGPRRDNSPSLDRFDNSLGYSKENINVISWKANRLKSNGTLEEFKKIVRWLEDNNV